MSWEKFDDDPPDWDDTHTAEGAIERMQEKHDGILRNCVYAECLESGIRVGPIWGRGEASVKRALATLTEQCTCGARFHYEGDEL